MIILLLLLSINSQAIETRDKVALIDTEITLEQRNSVFACKDEPVNFTDEEYYKNIDTHASILFNILSIYIDSKKTCIFSIKVFTNKEDAFNGKKMLDALRYVDSKEFKFFNMSFSGRYNSKEELDLIKRLTKRGAIAVAAGNDGLYLTKYKCEIYPACYDIDENFIVVGSMDNKKSNTGKEVVDIILSDIYTYMGSSMATSHVLGALIKGSYKKGE